MRANIFDWIKPDNYANVGSLHSFWKRAATMGFCERTESGFHNLVAAGLAALGGENPRALFQWIVGGKHWGSISEADDERARLLIKAWWQQQRLVESPLPKDVAMVAQRISVPESWEIVDEQGCQV